MADTVSTGRELRGPAFVALPIVFPLPHFSQAGLSHYYYYYSHLPLFFPHGRSQFYFI